ncbi:hypothetical protein [Tahibacter sp.]|uniref:hypothetical protein n=1 Tax=Tahibacter sp. TaxID=2056211 RepID=UPI0028C4FFC5|nr:hypothetical protein [Tahibacter sp.]
MLRSVSHRARAAHFFAPYGWRETEFHSAWDHAWRLDRKTAHASLLRALSWIAPRRKEEAVRRMSSIVLLQADDTPPSSNHQEHCA